MYLLQYIQNTRRRTLTYAQAGGISRIRVRARVRVGSSIGKEPADREKLCRSGSAVVVAKNYADGRRGGGAETMRTVERGRGEAGQK